MRYGLTENEIDLIKAVFEKVPEVETVYIYGSRARNTFKKTSDIDLAVKFKSGAKDKTAALKSDLDDLSIIYEIDLTSEEKMQSGNFKEEYERTKQIFYLKGWKTTTLGEVADVNNLTIDKNYPFKEIEYIDVASVEERNLLQTQKLKLSDAPSRAKRIVKDNNILISTVRPNLKHYCFIKKAKPNLVASTGFAVVSVKENKSDAFFLYNLLTTKEYTEYLIKIADTQTSTYPAFNPSIISNSKFVIPSLSEQRAIAAVLSSLDNKIELLREQNKALEATAQAVFKEWFVNFNFPNAEGKSYKASGGKMFDSELGKIPEGWRVGKLTEMFDFIKGIEPGSDNYSLQKLSCDYLLFYRVQDITTYGNSANVFVDKILVGERTFNVDDILISLDGTIGRVFIGGLGGYSSGIRKVIAKHDFIPKSLIFTFLKSDRFQGELISFSGAETTIKHAGGAIEHIKFVFEKSVCEKFGKAADPLFQKMISNISQIQTLSSLRDALLPKLMKGKLRVKGFDN